MKSYDYSEVRKDILEFEGLETLDFIIKGDPDKVFYYRLYSEYYEEPSDSGNADQLCSRLNEFFNGSILPLLDEWPVESKHHEIYFYKRSPNEKTFKFIEKHNIDSTEDAEKMVSQLRQTTMTMVNKIFSTEINIEEVLIYDTFINEFLYFATPTGNAAVSQSVQ